MKKKYSGVKCSYEGCEHSARSRGLCLNHYGMMMRRHKIDSKTGELVPREIHELKHNKRLLAERAKAQT